jgi:hypothetical protein
VQAEPGGIEWSEGRSGLVDPRAARRLLRADEVRSALEKRSGRGETHLRMRPDSVGLHGADSG